MAIIRSVGKSSDTRFIIPAPADRMLTCVSAATEHVRTQVRMRTQKTSKSITGSARARQAEAKTASGTDATSSGGTQRRLEGSGKPGPAQ